jgi:uncharacterized protein (TIGR03086 family)
MTSGPVGQLSAALETTGQLIASVRTDQWSEPTPCSQWNVRDLVGHLVAGNALFARALGSSEPEPDREAGQDDDLLPAYRASAAALAGAFEQPGVLEKIVTVPFGTVPGFVALHLRITEVLVHGWDLARATGQPATFADDVAKQELAFSRKALGDVPPDRSPFAPPQPVADDAPAIDRLAACLGRDVAAW